jgi:hypothetical protein
MSRPSYRRALLALAVACALMVGVLAGATSASASTLYACVKKNGSAHIYSKKPKCKKGESKLSWNTTGPAGTNGAPGAAGKNGANGTNGTNGSNGANGAVAGYFTAQGGPISITEEEQLILSKTLPPGNYLISAKVTTSAAGKNTGQMESRCELYDGATLDESQWISGLSEFLPGVFLGTSTLPLNTAVTFTKPTAIQVWCETELNKASSGEMTASHGALWAIQTTSNS